MKSESTWVDVHDDKLMISLGMRQPIYEGRDPSVWSHTSNEKKLLKKLRNKSYNLSKGGFSSKHIPIRLKLIVYLKKNKIFKNTTYSIIVNQHEIPRILNFYSDGSKTLVSKYNWAGKEYSPNELPWWY